MKLDIDEKCVTIFDGDGDDDTCIFFGLSIAVLGLINPTDIGVTLTHEHLSMNYAFAHREPSVGADNNVDKPLTLPNLGWVRQYP